MQYSFTNAELSNQKVLINAGSSSAEQVVEDMKMSKTDFGYVFGWRFGDIFRMWLSVLSSKAKYKDTDGSTTKFEGTSAFFGFGWHLVKGLSLNLEFGATIYSEEDGREYPITVQESGITMTATELTETAVMLEVSYLFGMY